MSATTTIGRPTTAGRKAKTIRAARPARRSTKARQADFLKAQLRGLCDRAARATGRLRQCDLDAEDVVEKLGELVRDLSETAMRVQVIEDALEVRAKLKDTAQALELLSVRQDDEDDVVRRIQRPMLAEARQRLAAVRH